jgi:hypothetical protein
MPTSIIDKPSFWIAFGLMEVSLPMIIPNKGWAGAVMFAVACATFAIKFDWLPAPQLPSAYSAANLVRAKCGNWRDVVAVLSAFIEISQSISSAQGLVAGLRDFGREWAGCFVGLPIGGYEILHGGKTARGHSITSLRPT